MNPSLHDLLTLAWFALMGVLLACYVITDGFDLGAGILSLAVSDETERTDIFTSITHVWDANETWLVVLGGALFGAFPGAYALILSQLYAPVTIMIGGLILRGAAIEFRHVARRRRGWDRAFGVGSLTAALAQGWILGSVVTGLGMDIASVVFESAAAIGVACGYVLLGSTYLLGKTSGGVTLRARQYATTAVFASVAAAIVLSAGTLLVSPVGRHRWHDPTILAILLAFATLAIAAIGVTLSSLRKGRSSLPFAATVVLFLASFGGLAVSVYPNLVPGRLSIAESVASDGTLVFMLFGIGALVPVMLGYNVYQYVVFRGKVASASVA